MNLRAAFASLIAAPVLLACTPPPAFAASPDTVFGEMLRVSCEDKPSGLRKCAVALPDPGMHRLDVTYTFRGVETYDTTSKYGPRVASGVERSETIRVPGFRVRCEQSDSRVSCVVGGPEEYAVRFYTIIDGEFFNWGGGGGEA